MRSINFVLLRLLVLISFLLFTQIIIAQNKASVSGVILTENQISLSNVNVNIKEIHYTTKTDTQGEFKIDSINAGKYTLIIDAVGYQQLVKTVIVKPTTNNRITCILNENSLIDKRKQLDEILVYGEKREDKVQKIASQITVINQNTIKNNSTYGLYDLKGLAPNLYVSNAGSPTLNFISLRGVFQFSESSSLVGVVIDDVPMLNAYSMSSEIQNIERIEVLRGPQSTLYGGNAFGGIIAITTKKPTNILNTYAELGVGNYNLFVVKAGVSGPLLKNKLYAGLSLYHNGIKGIYYNTTNKENYDDTKNTGANMLIKYNGQDGFSIRLNSRLEHNKLKGIFPYVNTKEQAFEKPYKNEADGKNFETRNLFTNSLLIKYENTNHIFSSVSGYTYLNDSFSDYDVDFTAYDLFKFSQNNPINTYTQEFKMSNKSNDKLKYVAGIYGFLDDRHNTQIRSYVGKDAVVLGPNYANAPFSLGNQTSRKEYGLAAFANTTYSITSKLEIIAGLRLDYSWREMILKGDFIKEPSLVMINPERNFLGKDNAISPRLGLAYKLKENLLLFTNYSRGFSPGGLNQYTTDANYTSYNPQYINTLELGQKSQWINNRLRTNTTLFYNKWINQQQTLFLPPDYVEQAVTNSGSLNIYGAETEITALLFKGFQIDYNLGLTKTNYTALNLLDPLNPTKNIDYKGNKQVFTPNTTSLLAISYSHIFLKNTTIQFKPEWKYFGLQHMNFYNNVNQGSFHLLNANLTIKQKIWEVTFWIKNATNTKYLSFFNAASVNNNGYTLLGTPQTLGTSIRVNL